MRPYRTGLQQQNRSKNHGYEKWEEAHNDQENKRRQTGRHSRDRREEDDGAQDRRSQDDGAQDRRSQNHGAQDNRQKNHAKSSCAENRGPRKHGASVDRPQDLIAQNYGA
jgi:hypothetical protein